MTDVKNYIEAFDELNVLTSTSFQLAGGDVNRIIDDILSFLIKAYKMGIENTSKMLSHDLQVNVDQMREAIYERIGGLTFEDRVAIHVMENDLQALQRLAESEFHRVYNIATLDGSYQFQDTVGLGVVKKWYTVNDDKVRETHKYLEGAEIALDEEFWTFDGDHAPYPGGFTLAENNVNCRCVMDMRTDTTQV